MKNLLKAILRTLILILLILGLFCGLMIIIMPIVTITICGICYISNTFKITNTEWLMIIIIPLIIGLIYGNYKCIKQEQKEKGIK